MQHISPSKIVIERVGSFESEACYFVRTAPRGSLEECNYSALRELQHIEIILKKNLCHYSVDRNVKIESDSAFFEFLGLKAKEIHADYFSAPLSRHTAFFTWLQRSILGEEAEVRASYRRIQSLLKSPWETLCVDLICQIQSKLLMADASSLFRVNKSLHKHSYMLFNRVGYVGTSILAGGKHLRALCYFLRDSKSSRFLPKRCINGGYVNWEELNHLSTHEILSLLGNLIGCSYSPEVLLRYLKKNENFNLSSAIYSEAASKAMEYAFKSGASMIDFLMDKGFDVNTYFAKQNLYGDSIKNPFLVALIERCGSLELVKKALDLGANVNAKNSFAMTPLHKACLLEADAYEMTHMLLMYGADPNVRDEKGKFLLHHAAENGQEKIVKLLIEHRAWQDVVEDSKQMTPIHLAALNGYGGVVKHLLHAGNLNALDRKGHSLLHLLCKSKTDPIDMVEYLLEAGVDANIPNKKGKLPLHIAAKSGHIMTALKLLSACPQQINAKDANGWTFFMHACDSKAAYTKELVRMTVSDVTIHGSASRFQPLHVAALRGRASIVDVLLQKGADVNALGFSNQTPLNLACVRSKKYGGHVPNAKVVKLLLKYGADPTIPDDFGRSPSNHAMPPFDTFLEAWELLKEAHAFRVEADQKAKAT